MQEFSILKYYNVIKINPSPEIWLKSMKVRMRMINTLMDNIKVMLNHFDVKFHKYQLTKDNTRVLFFFGNENIEKALNIIKNVMGIESFSPVLRTSNQLNNILQRTIEVGEEILDLGDSFAIRVKRSGKHEFTSQDVAKKAGQAILENFKNLNLKVNLSHPKKIIYIEIRNEFSYIFTDIIKSRWEGLPLEYNKRVLCMDIGRIEDLLAGFLILKRGCVLHPILFLINEDQQFIEKWLSNWKQIVKYSFNSKIELKLFNLVNILKVVEKDLSLKHYICALCRLIRYALLAKILNETIFEGVDKIKAITDGLSLNNSSTCTDDVDLESISLNYMFSDYPIFTPLIGFNNKQIKDALLDVSSELRPLDYCSFKPKNQHIDIDEVQNMYKSLKLDVIIDQIFKKMEIFTVN